MTNGHDQELEWLRAGVNCATVLENLAWFGLLEYRVDEIDLGRLERRHFYRKTALFDRFLSFDVTLEKAEGPRH